MLKHFNVENLKKYDFFNLTEQTVYVFQYLNNVLQVQLHMG